MTAHAVAAVVIFLVSFGFIIAGEKSPRKMDRPTVALIGALLLVICGVLTRGDAIRAVDWGTIALLLGMMVVIHFVTESGLLDAVSARALAKAGNPSQLLWTVCAVSGVLSALFVNDTICLVLTPLLLLTTRRLRLPAEPYLLALATSSNVGSVMTLTGNPQNMLIGQVSGWTWGAFALRMIPIGLVCLGVNAAVLTRMYRKEWDAIPSVANEPSAESVSGVAFHQQKMRPRVLLVLAGLLIAFLFGAPMDIAALSAAAFLLVWANRAPEEAFATVDWSLLLFFAGLFVIVEGVTKTGGAFVARWTLAAAQNPESLWGLTRFSLVSVIGSNIFSNVPFVMLLRGAGLAHAPNAPLLWLALASSSTLAGNLTLVGSIANMIVAQRAAKGGVTLSFGAFLRAGAVTTALTILVSVAMLWVYHFWHWI